MRRHFGHLRAGSCGLERSMLLQSERLWGAKHVAPMQAEPWKASRSTGIARRTRPCSGWLRANLYCVGRYFLPHRAPQAKPSQAKPLKRCAISRGLGAGDADRRLLRRWNHRDGRHERYGGRGRRRRRPHMDEDRYRPRRTPVPQACITYLWRSRICSRRSARPSRTPAAPSPPQELHGSLPRPCCHVCSLQGCPLCLLM